MTTFEIWLSLFNAFIARGNEPAEAASNADLMLPIAQERKTTLALGESKRA